MLLTNSAIAKFEECQRKYYWRYVRELVQEETAPALEVGRLFHRGLQHWYEHLRQGDNPELAKKAGMLAASDDGDNGIMARWLTRLYIEHYGVDPWEIVEVEHKFSVKTEGVEVAGKIDLIVRDEKGLWFVEHKTASNPDAAYLKRLALDRQIILYLWAARTAGCEVQGVIYNIIAKPTKYRRKGEGMAEYLGRCEMDYAAQPTTHFVRERCFRGRQDEEEIGREIRRNVEQIRLCWTSGFFPKHRDRCFPFRHKHCPYADLCIEGENVRTLSLYKHEKAHVELEDEADEVEATEY